MNERRLDQCRTSRPARTLFALALGALLAPLGLMGCASSTSSGSTYHDAATADLKWPDNNPQHGVTIEKP